MNKLFDLRFVIGCFFLIVGVLLLLYGFFTNSVNNQTVNRSCGAIFSIFGIVMLALSYRSNTNDNA
jgi:uncharacterized membrane protein HdeD (DUF308 family)